MVKNAKEKPTSRSSICRQHPLDPYCEHNLARATHPSHLESAYASLRYTEFIASGLVAAASLCVAIECLMKLTHLKIDLLEVEEEETAPPVPLRGHGAGAVNVLPARVAPGVPPPPALADPVIDRWFEDDASIAGRVCYLCRFYASVFEGDSSRDVLVMRIFSWIWVTCNLQHVIRTIWPRIDGLFPRIGVTSGVSRFGGAFVFRLFGILAA